MKESRTLFWVDSFQTKLFFRVSAYWLIYTFTLFNLLFGWRLYRDGTSDLWDVFVATFYDNIPLFITFVLVAPWIGLDAVQFANRIVGPIWRFRRTMQDVTANDPVRPIRLRKNDFLLDMQDDFNAMLDALEQRGAVHKDPAILGASQNTAKVGG